MLSRLCLFLFRFEFFLHMACFVLSLLFLLPYVYLSTFFLLILHLVLNLFFPLFSVASACYLHPIAFSSRFFLLLILFSLLHPVLSLFHFFKFSFLISCSWLILLDFVSSSLLSLSPFAILNETLSARAAKHSTSTLFGRFCRKTINLSTASAGISVSRAQKALRRKS